MRRLTIQQTLNDLESISPRYFWAFCPKTQQFLVCPMGQVKKELPGLSLCLNELACDVFKEIEYEHYILSECMYNYLETEVTCCRCDQHSDTLVKVPSEGDPTHLYKICNSCSKPN